MPGLEFRKIDQQELVKTRVLSEETNSRKKETLGTLGYDVKETNKIWDHNATQKICILSAMVLSLAPVSYLSS